jgi:hypothetical protein
VRCIWNAEEVVEAACGWGLRLLYPRLGLGFPAARSAARTLGCSSPHHVYHEPCPCYEAYHCQAQGPRFCEQVARHRNASYRAPDNQDRAPVTPPKAYPTPINTSGDATAKTMRIEGSWLIINRTPIPVEPTASRTRPSSKKVAAAPVATTRPSVATMTQSFNNQATPPAMRALPAMEIHHF